MPKRIFTTGEMLEPFSGGLREGFTPRQIKEGIIALLDPYIHDKEVLQDLAVNHLAGEAICVARLFSKRTWQDMFEFVLKTREDAISKSKQEAYEALVFFQSSIIETQRKYALQIEFEIVKDNLDLDEFAFELFRNIGSVIESTIQPFLKEFHCLLLISNGKSVNPSVVAQMDLGTVVDRSLRELSDSDLLAPAPWSVRLNQWRNIAQHQTFKVTESRIVAQYGKSSPRKEIELTRNELLLAAQEISSRLAILRTSRVFAMVNAGEELMRLMPSDQDDISAIAVTLIASFATQGFTLVSLEEKDGKVIASLRDAAPEAGEKRFIHASQFLVVIAAFFPGRFIEVHLRTPDDQEHWVFSLDVIQSGKILLSEDPLKELANTLDWASLLQVARNNEANHG